MFGLLWMHEGTSRPLVAAMLIPAGLGLGFAVPSLTAVLLNGITADRAGMGAVMLNSFRQTGCALAVAVLGALVANRGEFIVGLRVALCVAVVMLVATTAAALMLPHDRG